MNYVEMRLRPEGNIVRVYSINDGIAQIFDLTQFQKSDQGWGRVKVSRLVPMDLPLHAEHLMSKTKKNKAKKRLKLVDAVWQSTDGCTYTHAEIEDAIAHEAKLMEAEVKSETITPTTPTVLDEVVEPIGMSAEEIGEECVDAN